MRYAEKEARALDLIASAVHRWPKIVLGCSFGKDSMVTLHLVRRVAHSIPVFSVMADTEFSETYAFAQLVTVSYSLAYKQYDFVQPMAARRNPVQCCAEEKVAATKAALVGYDAWISGVRSAEGISRAAFAPIEERGGLVKVNPVLDFTELDIWRYTGLHALPVHPRYRMGYRSLGCAICSVPEGDESETERAGRWPGTARSGGECGIHTETLR